MDISNAKGVNDLSVFVFLTLEEWQYYTNTGVATLIPKSSRLSCSNYQKLNKLVTRSTR